MLTIQKELKYKKIENYREKNSSPGYIRLLYDCLLSALLRKGADRVYRLKLKYYE